MLPAISAAVVRHTGHMGFSLPATRRSRCGLLPASLGVPANTTVHRGPAFVHPSLCSYSSWRRHQGPPVLVAAVGGRVEPLVHAPEAIQSARIGRIGVVDDAVFAHEAAHARPV